MKIITQFSKLMLLFSIITLSACGDKQGDEQGNSQTNKTKQPVVQAVEVASATSEYPAEPRVEVYGDKSIWSTPRI